MNHKHWDLASFLFVVAQLLPPATHIIFFSLFIFIWSIIHVLLKWLYMHAAESLQGGGVHASAAV